jgi:hypothetical protein
VGTVFPGGLTTAAGRFIVVEMDDIEFDGATARAYIVENLVPNDATLSEDAAVNPKPLDSAAPPGRGECDPLSHWAAWPADELAYNRGRMPAPV